MTKPWTDVLIETKDYTVYKDGFPVTEGHVLFVPREENWKGLTKCMEAAYKWGHDWMTRGYCDAFNIGQNVGEAAGQTVMYPHIHLICLINNDSNFKSSMRICYLYATEYRLD
jgi:histidine triad (HIT) family protein